MPSVKLLTGVALFIFASAVGCEPFSSPTATPVPFFNTTIPVPTVPPATQTSTLTATAVPSATPPLPIGATRLPTGAFNAAATATRTSERPTLTPTPQPTLAVQTILVAPGQPGRLYAFMIDQLSQLDRNPALVFVSDDMGSTWSPFSGGLPVGPDCIVNVNLDYATTDALFAGTCQSIFRWTGSTWAFVSDLQPWTIAVTYRQPSNLWAAAASSKDGPIVRSVDGGATWRGASEGLVRFDGVANLAIDPRDARTIYAIIVPKYGGSYLRRKTGHNQWETMPTPLNNSQIDVGMTIDGATGALYVTAYDGMTTPGQGYWQVWRSTNPSVEMDSVKWEKVYDFGDANWATMLASGWSPQGLSLYAGVRLANEETAVFRSLDSGKTWSALKIP